LYEASHHVELSRLPELFCGFHKRADSSGPTLYPVACSPQAWAAGSVFLLLRAVLGIAIRAPERTIRFSNPVLPANLDELIVENLRVADAVVDLLFRRHPEGVGVEVLRRSGDIEVVKSV
jgi:glycogen debranching enzyme